MLVTNQHQQLEVSPEIWRAKRQDTCSDLNTATTVALFIIGIIGSTGIIPGVGLCGATIGLSISQFLTSLMAGIKPVDEDTLKKRQNPQQQSFGINNEPEETDRRYKIVFDAVYPIVLIILSSLALAGYVPRHLVGWATFVPIVILYVAICCDQCNRMTSPKPRS